MPPKKTKRGKRNAAPAESRHRLKVLVAALFLLGFLVLSLVFLAHLRESLPPSPPPHAAREVLLDDVRVELESALLRSGISLNQFEAEAEAGQMHFVVRGEYPPPAIIEDLSLRLARLSGAFRVEARAASREVRVYRQDDLWAILRFEVVVTAAGDGTPRVAIIMDDLGADMATARALLEIDLPVTFAVLPGTANASRVATLAHRRGREVMIHIPMEPRSYPETSPGGDALLVRHGAEEIRRRFQGYLEKIPYAAGGNNHMGSRFTESREGMAAVLAAMKAADLFFVDSRTSGGSVAFAEARRAGLPAAARDVFLDNDREVEKIGRQLRLLLDLAERRGAAIGICHPYPETLEALRQVLPDLRARGVVAVPVSQVLVRPRG